MRKIAARAGITPGAIYKHFSGKEDMFEEIFAESGNKLMQLTESMLNIDFSAMSDDQLIQILYSRISVRTFELLEGDMQLFHMLLKNDSGTYLNRFRKIYIDPLRPIQPAVLFRIIQTRAGIKYVIGENDIHALIFRILYGLRFNRR